VELAGGGGTARLYSLLHEGRFVLLERGGGSSPSARLALPRACTRIEYVAGRGADLPAATLIRPDGYIAWASDEHEASARAAQARVAVRDWCGPTEGREADDE
jgi:hypothetical protein